MILYCNNCAAKTGQLSVWNAKLTTFGDTYYIFQCNQCSHFIYAAVHNSPQGPIVMDRYPFEEKVQALQGVPEQIMEDFLEAQKCFNAGSNKGCATMCRRALQNAAEEKGAKKGDLYNQLEWLKDQQILYPKLFELATSVRLVGKKGAHPAKQKLLDKVTKEEAETMLSFTSDVLNYLYGIDHKIKQYATSFEKPES